MNEPMLITEFLDELQRRADQRFNGHLHQSFVSWYVEAEIGAHAVWHFTDGPNDSGIDAVVWCENDDPPVMVLQSKFSKQVGRNKLGASAYDDFESVVRAFRYGGEEFEQLLKGAADEFRKYYRKAKEKLADYDWHTAKKAFRIVTTSRRSIKKEFSLIPTDNYVYYDRVLDRYRRFRVCQTPIARPLQIQVQGKLPYDDQQKGTVSYLFNAPVSDFRRYLEKSDVNVLVARNIRFEVPTGKKVRNAIRQTYEKNPKDFWYLHNGLTILCDNYMEDRNQTATLVNPSVINGAQTLYAIAVSDVKESSALVVVRAIVRGEASHENFEDDKWVQKIIRGVNTQNKVEPPDFRANDPAHAELQKRFDEQRVFYERKRGEFRHYRADPKYKGHTRVGIAVLGQILSTVSDAHGEGLLLAKRGPGEIFSDEKVYAELFPSRKTIAARFKRIYLAYRLFSLIRDCQLGCPTKHEYRKRLASFWHVVWVSHCVLTQALAKSSLSVEQIRRTFDIFEGFTQNGIRARKALKDISKAVWRAYRVGKKKDPEHWTPNNFFKQKYGVNVVAKIAMPKAKRLVNELARMLGDPASF